MCLKRQWRIWDVGVRLWVALLAIFNFGAAPLPCPEYHDVDHHDEPGQSCPFHDHLTNHHHHHSAAVDDFDEPASRFHCHWVPLRQQLPPLSDSDQEADGPRTDLPQDQASPILADGWIIDQSCHRYLVTVDIHLRSDLLCGFDISLQFDQSGFLITRFLTTFSPHIAMETLLSRWLF